MYILMTYSVDISGYVEYDDENAYDTLNLAQANLYNYIYLTFFEENDGLALNFTPKMKQKLIKDFGEAVDEDIMSFDIWAASKATPYVKEMRENFKALTIRIINTE